MAMNESASPRKHPLRSCAVARYERHHSLAAIGHGPPRRYIAGLSVYFTERDAVTRSSRLPSAALAPTRTAAPNSLSLAKSDQYQLAAAPQPIGRHINHPGTPVPRRLRALHHRAKPLIRPDGAKCAIRSHLALGNPT
jgi:hypothetical protein